MSGILTVPNGLTALRALGIPLFIYLTLSRGADGYAVIVLIIGGATDYFDGKIARAWNQESRLGELLDPAIDRLYIAATLVVFYIRDVVPVWLILLIVGRDIVLGVMTLAMHRLSIPPFKVTYLGKAATFNLLYAFPLLLLAHSESQGSVIAYIFGWSFAVWGIGLYLATGADYFKCGWRLIRRKK
ncbi:MAG: CDP-alcohol phosphatidyltransferase family protein [Actinobacteria bacterium]|nr:CDP-alcohol phosphatidyltransferase family protein [Actinomycetota bacterium]